MKRKVKEEIIAFIVCLFFVGQLLMLTSNYTCADTIVYITKTGDCYHNSGCSSLKRSCIPIGLSDAISRGYSRCQKCNAPSSNSHSSNNTSSNGASDSNVSTSSNNAPTDIIRLVPQEQMLLHTSVTNPARGTKPVTVQRPEINGFRYADFARYNSFASDNGLGGELIYISGKVDDVIRYNKTNSYGIEINCVIIMLTDVDGYQWTINFAVNSKYVNQITKDYKGKNATLFGKYSGYSGVLLRPVMELLIIQGEDGTSTNVSTLKY